MKELELLILKESMFWGNLIVAFQYLKGLQERWRGTFDKGMECQDKGEWI